MTIKTPGKPISEKAEEKLQTGGDSPATPAISNVDEQEIADFNAAKSGDQAAFARIYDRHAAVVLSLCRRLSLTEAEDATQETFIRAYRLLEKVESANKLRPWLYGIARRVCSEFVRSKQRRKRHEGQAMLIKTAEQSSKAVTPTDSVEHAEQMQQLDKAIDQLDDRQRLAIHLYYLEKDPVQSAQSTLGLSRSGYYKLLAKARDSLAQLMLSSE
ncbi:MAG: sigma-70 family RNA polymerase sigma factor [Planctomycetes bacterium]|nr:sigma-70 family RNA polymerase sigma factor [Planctomycetota bacterium]